MKKINLLLLFLITSPNITAQSTSLHEDFSTCISSIPSGWIKYSVTGTDSWQCTSAGQSGQGTTMNGYSGGSYHNNEDWLISPQLDFNLYNSPMLSFWCRTKYTGNIIQVFTSSNYSGSGNPNSATWTLLPAVLPTVNSDTWFLSDNIDLSSFKNQPLYIAFKYISTTSAAATWRIDEVNVNDGNLSLSKKFINVGQCGAGFSTDISSFTFNMSGTISSFAVDVPSPFEISKDGISFSNQLTYSSSISGTNQTVYVRASPMVADKVFRSQINFILNGNTLAEKVLLLGTSLPDDKTLRVLNWNMRWFGDPSSCGCDTNLARINSTQILKDIHADIYCLQEVVNGSKIALIASALGPNYQYVVSPFCSFATNTSSSSYASGQKLAYIYNTDKIENLGTFGLLASTYPSDTSSNSAYYCFSSGRFPFIMKAKLKLNNGQSDTIIISNIHAKAVSDISSYNRRKCGAEKMTDSLNVLFPNKKVLVVGDYNDYLEGSSVASMSATPYKYLLDNGFSGITLPSHYVNQTTFVGSPNTIFDNVACTSNLMSLYPDSSCFFFNEVENYIQDYSSTTSDHIPVMSYFKFNFPNATNDISTKIESDIFHIVNPSNNILQLHVNENLNDDYLISVFDITGHLIFKHREFIHSSIKLQVQNLNPGLYFVNLKSNKNSQTIKWQVN